MAKIVRATGAAVGFMAADDTTRRIEAAMVKAIEDTPRKDGESQRDFDHRVREAIRKAVEKARDGL